MSKTNIFFSRFERTRGERNQIFRTSVTSSRGVKPTKQSSFDNFVKCGQAQDSKMSIEKLRSDWNLMTDEEKLEFRTQTSAVDYRALDCGDLFFDSDE